MIKDFLSGFAVGIGVCIIIYFTILLPKEKESVDIESLAKSRADSLHYYQSSPGRQQEIIDSLTAIRSKERK